MVSVVKVPGDVSVDRVYDLMGKGNRLMGEIWGDYGLIHWVMPFIVEAIIGGMR